MLPLFTKSLTFNKEEANYRRESRFQTENLYTLAQLASVYNVTAETKPALDIFPGMLIWVNPGMYQSPSVRYSIANILGMGGFHIVESVTHTGNINKNTISGFKTSITANWISNGTINNKFHEIKPEDTEEKTPETPTAPSPPKEPKVQEITKSETPDTPEEPKDSDVLVKFSKTLGTNDRDSGLEGWLIYEAQDTDLNAIAIGETKKEYPLQKVKYGKSFVYILKKLPEGEGRYTFKITRKKIK